MESKVFLHDISKLYWFFLPSHTRKAIRAEVAAQIKKYKEAGFTEMHCDSHGLSHTFLSVYLAIRKELKKNGFKTMRISLNLYTHKMSKLKKYING